MKKGKFEIKVNETNLYLKFFSKIKTLETRQGSFWAFSKIISYFSESTNFLLPNMLLSSRLTEPSIRETAKSSSKICLIIHAEWR